MKIGIVGIIISVDNQRIRKDACSSNSNIHISKNPWLSSEQSLALLQCMEITRFEYRTLVGFKIN